MNNNQEKNQKEKGNREPIAPRIAKFSAFIYLGLAITVVIVATVGIFSISYDYEENANQISFPEIDVPDSYSTPQIVITPEDTEKNDNVSHEHPVGNEESGVEDVVITPESQPEEENRVMYYNPVSGEIQKEFSMSALVFSETMQDYRVHSGIDITATAGTPVLAYADGTIASVEQDYFYGMTVSIVHDGGLVSYYMNLDPTLAANIAVGAPVSAGQEIGIVGNTAKCEKADEEHLHFEMRVNDILIDPVDKLP